MCQIFFTGISDVIFSVPYLEAKAAVKNKFLGIEKKKMKMRENGLNRIRVEKMDSVCV